MSAKQHQFLSSGLPTDPTNSQKCVSNFSSTWLAHQTIAFLTGQPLHAPKSWYTAGGPMSHSLSTVGLSVAKAASSQPGFLTQVCFIFKDICVSHLPSPTSLCAINKLQGLELTEPLCRNLGWNNYLKKMSYLTIFIGLEQKISTMYSHLH